MCVLCVWCVRLCVSFRLSPQKLLDRFHHSLFRKLIKTLYLQTILFLLIKMIKANPYNIALINESSRFKPCKYLYSGNEWNCVLHSLDGPHIFHSTSYKLARSHLIWFFKLSSTIETLDGSPSQRREKPQNREQSPIRRRESPRELKAKTESMVEP